ncbi:MAG: hypothetical protein A3H61_02630 [Candidatus Jacksonbacteria bacterium RIFCSPLOWO2_02_FULL_44_20]|uniref:Uncharacterized protein n=1 Tax=Candidatus Jacksonbacteria bacterium RIFCSPLOWO2_02_FULL_44_20 TaxID=1798460 RepID=A0A1G2A8G8_9BACT|nr:MAG: hypothetical protein A3E05_02650 [Candidatus Jacksonbacteria bacterium RIFCSPHIGHO2_12_FULL_44_12]OGY71839.1 MAG: hypothetical protein A3C00_01450 [Candidatus Jacksonbacteria bacterium RIFCSPHIGHO2_02_FULL_44_25]OGY73081.1 MAG: hypothetical protein A3H61_02630 [Candidatus Jacksonbacteria bacterium RIFCSPLOWO2_02_FULL_44_20]HCA66926.1 hypothetical protein [Candidatus Jacksonbacteria bacterium]HCE86774.1 hypothetical protein [Candidatus Jacksonbacteria bacterium]
MTITPWNGPDQNVALQCVSNRCVVPKQFVAIGTWCGTGIHCEDETSVLQFTCKTDNNICVAAVNGVACIDELARLNKDQDIGTLGTSIPESDRCATGLVCDIQESGLCQNDFGQGEVPADKLGDAASDIRDQIRELLNIALGFLGVAGVIVTMYGGALWMASAGDDEKVEKAKKTIVAGLIGLVIIGISWTIVSYVLKITQTIA